jgi:site-specific DNA-methyltransferase (adenine-specific)
MKNIELKLGDCNKILKKVKAKSIDMIFADPPYNLSGKTHLTVKSGRPVPGNKGDWDIIDDYEKFTAEWMAECIRVLKDNGTIWISGTLHNHPTVGVMLKKLGMWIVNDIVWFKPNATPLLQTTRLAPSIELIWLAAKSKKYYFDYPLAKEINGGKQMRNMWQIPAQRHKTKHPTEKPEILLERIIAIGSKKGDRILDPFMGSGTTGVVAKALGRKFLGIESDKEYFADAQERIKNTKKITKMSDFT